MIEKAFRFSATAIEELNRQPAPDRCHEGSLFG